MPVYLRSRHSSLSGCLLFLAHCLLGLLGQWAPSYLRAYAPVAPSAWNALPSQRVTVSPCLMSRGGGGRDGGLVTKSCLPLCDPVDCSHQAPLSMGFPRQEYWRGLPFPSLLASSSSAHMPSFQGGLAMTLSKLLLMTCCHAVSLFRTLFFL